MKYAMSHKKNDEKITKPNKKLSGNSLFFFRKSDITPTNPKRDKKPKDFP